jgi:hypothetical protein
LNEEDLLQPIDLSGEARPFQVALANRQRLSPAKSKKKD